MDQARLMKSEIIGNYILLGSCGTHSKQAGKKESWIGANQIQVTSSTSEEEEVLISIMDTMIIEDVEQMEV